MIQLTEFDHCDDDGKARAVWVQPAYIVRIYQRPTSFGPEGFYTRVETRGAHFNVVETPEQILHAIGVANAKGAD